VIQEKIKAHTNLEIVGEARGLLRQCRDIVTFSHVYSHTGKDELHSIGNEIADMLAGEEIK
jgi:hypothetical protein